MKSGWVRILVTLGSIILIINLVRSSYSLWQKGSIISDQIAEKAKLEKENQALKKRLLESESLGFVEQQARDKLNLQKEGEMVVVIPNNARASPPVSPSIVPNWQLWWKLFF